MLFEATGLKMGSRNVVGPPLSTTPAAGWKPGNGGMGDAIPYEEKGEKGVGCGWNMPPLVPALYLLKEAVKQAPAKRFRSALKFSRFVVWFRETTTQHRTQENQGVYGLVYSRCRTG